MLNENLRKQYMEALGYSYNKKGILEMQKKYFIRSKDMDGIYGNDTDILLRNLYNFKLSGIVKNFKLEEFRCECGGRYCTGYPAVVSQAQLKMVQAIRTHYGKPMTVTCGLRCSTYNKKLNGSIANSSHLKGYATDYYGKGVTDTLANRKASIKWIKKQSNHAYTYGDGINSNGVKVNASYMGNALHTDTKLTVKDIYPTIKNEVSPKVEEHKKEEPKLTAQEQRIKNIKAFAKKYANDDSYKYRKWSESNKYTHQCPLCHPESNKHATKGWNCRGFAAACLYHGGEIKTVECSCKGLGLLGKSLKDFTLANWEKYNGPGWKRIYNGGKSLKLSQLQDGDVSFYFDSSNKMKHVAIVYDVKNGKIVDSTSSKGIKIRKPAGYGYVAFRYIGE